MHMSPQGTIEIKRLKLKISKEDGVTSGTD